MKTMITINFYECELQAIFQYEEYSYCEVRPNHDKQLHMVGLSI